MLSLYVRLLLKGRWTCTFGMDREDFLTYPFLGRGAGYLKDGVGHSPFTPPCQLVPRASRAFGKQLSRCKFPLPWAIWQQSWVHSLATLFLRLLSPRRAFEGGEESTSRPASGSISPRPGALPTLPRGGAPGAARAWPPSPCPSRCCPPGAGHVPTPPLGPWRRRPSQGRVWPAAGPPEPQPRAPLTWLAL